MPRPWGALREAADILVAILAPLMPHLAEECNRALGSGGLVAEADWPDFDQALVTDESITLPVQINGKKRGDLTIARDADQLAVERAVLELAVVQAALSGGEPPQDHRRSAEDRECRHLIVSARSGFSPACWPPAA